MENELPLNLPGMSRRPSKQAPRFHQKYHGGIVSQDKKYVIFMGIIDIFTHYGTFKKFEHLIKKKVQGDTISCVPPQIYSQRFKEFIFKNLA